MSDDATGEYFMLYFDDRKVSRKYEVSFQSNTPEFSQRYSWIFADNAIPLLAKENYQKTKRPAKKI